MIFIILFVLYIHDIQNKRFGLNLDHSQCDCEMSLEKEHIVIIETKVYSRFHKRSSVN